MKTFVRHAVALLAVTAACQAGRALAEEFRWLNSGSPSTTLVGEEKAVAKEQAPSSSCGQCLGGESCGACGSCESGCGCSLGCDDCPSLGIVGFAGLDSFKGISDSFLNSNFGAVGGLNAGAPIPGLSDYNLGWQLGMSYGVYDLDGRALNDEATSQQQIFVTTGFFRKASCDRRLSFGLVYDWMINTDWGYLATSPTLGQWRGQIEYALSGCNAIGVWGCVRDLGSSQIFEISPRISATAQSRAIGQANVFWHHKFCSGADSWLWLGIPEQERLSGEGSLGAWMVGANVQVPLTDTLALYANGSYFRPSGSAGSQSAIEEGYDVGMGVMWYFGRRAVSHSINGGCWTPYMPLGNNSNFLVDQNVSVN